MTSATDISALYREFTAALAEVSRKMLWVRHAVAVSQKLARPSRSVTNATSMHISPPEVKDKMFNPFFTTKPAGEGTGLGLSISHDIIVKQLAGSIEVETEPGKFTEFRIILPRTGATAAKSGDARERSHPGG